MKFNPNIQSYSNTTYQLGAKTLYLITYNFLYYPMYSIWQKLCLSFLCQLIFFKMNK